MISTVWRAYPSSRSECHKKRHSTVKLCSPLLGLPGHWELLPPRPPVPRRVQGCKQGNWPKTSAQQEAGEGGRGPRLALGEVNRQIQLIQSVRGRKDPGFICYPEPPRLTPALLGALRLCGRESQPEPGDRFLVCAGQQKHRPPWQPFLHPFSEALQYLLPWAGM